MTFNIRYATANDGDHRWEHRKNAVIERIQAWNPDLLGLQECRDDAQATFIKRKLPNYQFYGYPRGGPEEPGLEMTPILYKTDLFKELDKGTFWLSDTPEAPSSRNWGSYFPRTVTWIRLQIKTTPHQTLSLVNTHLDYAPGVPYRSAKVLRNWLNQFTQDIPVILSGDFNTKRGSAAYRLLTEGPAADQPFLQDTIRSDILAENGTFHDFGRIADPLPFDWILATPHFRILEAGVDQTQIRGIYPSDHYPVFASLALVHP